ncbi:MAG: cardiolipin synthase [Verrucomicrobiota bacterium]|jgi:cardiolipin synthase|nr:cardiolipin synthase [Verrucomicrobiota bacterium]MDK2963524.1 cardiolipin synthase [Verrucomicrobiota bacterium]
MTERPFLLLIGWLIHLVAFILVTLHCLQRRRNAASTILWIFVAWSFPIIGPLVYLGFGVDRVSDRGYLKFLADEHLLETRKILRNTAPRAYWHNMNGVPAENAFQRELNHSLNALLPNHPALAGNHLTPLEGGDETYPRMLEAIRQAKYHIHLQSYIIGNDSISREFMNALAAKAAEGVQVRLLYDRFGSTKALFGGLFRRARKIPNFKVAGWTQANPLKRQFQINLRNHRKILVIDGKNGFFGGVNIHASHLTRPGKPPIRDYHFHVKGPLVQELQYSFLRDWYFITREAAETLLTEDYFPSLEPAGTITARLINSGPSTEQEVAVETFFNSIILAKKQIFAVTPYFVPPVDILRALRSAALRGVDVHLVVPQKNNHLYAGYASRALYEELLNAGVHIHERRPPFMHAKALVIDGEFVLIGTANIDERSLKLNYETCAAAYSTEFANAMKQIIHEDINCSDEIILSEWRKRPATQRLIENLAALMSPVL